MPNKETPYEFYLHLNQKREIGLPWQLIAAGEIFSQGNERYHFQSYGTVEVCLRLDSTEEYAEDWFDGRLYRTSFPHLIVKRPGAPYHYQIKGRRHGMFFIYPPETEDAFRAAGIDLSFFTMGVTLDAELERMLGECRYYANISQQRYIAERLDLLAFRIFHYILIKQKTVENLRPQELRIRQIASYLQLHLNQPLELDELCKKFAISRRNLFRLWQEVYHISPARYVLELKMREAERLLTTENLSVGEIANLLGFSETNYFILVFRKVHGQTPLNYRKAMRLNVLRTQMPS